MGDRTQFAIPAGGGNADRSLFAFILVALILMEACFPINSQGASAKTPDFNVFVGKWVRHDGGYVIHVRDIKPDGKVDAGYFNPREIHVAEAKVSTQEDLMKLYMRLEGKGYPGSTYTLYYYAEKDVLAGFYYQAAMDQTFEVVFVRQKGKE
jgi:hypothetical protein